MPRKPTPKQALAALVKAGAVANLPDFPTLDFYLADAAWVTDRLDGKVLRWCPLHPGDQSDIHQTPYDKAVVAGTPAAWYVNLYKDDQFVWGAGPVAEFDVDLADWQDQWGRWQALLGVGDNQARWDHFFQLA